jgi:hypothetical protein
MHMSFNGKEHMYISINWMHVLIRELNLEVHGCSHYPGMSNALPWK